MFVHDRCRWAFQEIPCTSCTRCMETAGVFQCCGCGGTFCSRDSHIHREELRNQLVTVKKEYYEWDEKWKLDWAGFMKANDASRALRVQEIQSWEENSIAAIKKAADEARRKVNDLFNLHSQLPAEFTQRTKWFMQRVDRAEKREDFHEEHLKRWKIAIDCLRRTLSAWVVDFVKIDYIEPFIKKLVVEEIQAPATDHDFPDDIDITPPFKLTPVVVGRPTAHNPVELRSGVRQFHFKSNYVFLGVASNNPNVNRGSRVLSGTYGWTGDNRVYVNGAPDPNHQGYQIDMEFGDRLLLEVDCERTLLRLTNERTRHTDELNVNTDNCPLPWQLIVQYLDDFNE